MNYKELELELRIIEGALIRVFKEAKEVNENERSSSEKGFAYDYFKEVLSKD